MRLSGKPGGWVFTESAKQRVWRYTVPPSTGPDAPLREFFLGVGRRDWGSSGARGESYRSHQ